MRARTVAAMTDALVTPVDLDARLGDLVAAEPAHAAVLERFGIDYCCHGGRTLRRAVTDAGLDATTVAEALAAVRPDPAGAEVARMAPVELTQHIVATHHTYLWDELPALDALAAKVAGVHGARHPELPDVARLVSALRADLEPHLTREEQVLFPAIGELAGGGGDFAFGAITNPIRVMLLEHEQAGELLAELRTVSGDYDVPAAGCASYRSLYERLEALEADTFRHIHLENNVLFPAVEALAG